MTIIPPIKSQGIKTKLTGWIQSTAGKCAFDRWIEPFMGTGCVAFNVQPRIALLCDINPHLISFYKAIQHGSITPETVRHFLIKEGEKLLKSKGQYYYEVRDRFNKTNNPLDFLFLSRACFNGLMRFNRKREFNVPFCCKPNRFSQALITKICNQIKKVSQILVNGDYTFQCQDFRKTIAVSNRRDMIYCDPPYIGRHVNYFSSWSEVEEITLHQYLTNSDAKFMLSTWLKNKYRINEYVFSTWSDCFITTREHFYYVGGKVSCRHVVTEALLSNFAISH